MVRSNEDGQKSPKVTFKLVVRPASTLQKEAGRQLFSRLLERTRKGNKDADGKPEVGAAGDPAQPSPAPAPHSLSGGQKLQSKGKRKKPGEWK